MLNSHIWLVATLLDCANTAHLHLLQEAQLDSAALRPSEV